MMVGEYYNLQFNFTGNLLLIFAILLASMAAILAIVYFIAKPLFLKMTATPFEFEKNEYI